MLRRFACVLCALLCASPRILTAATTGGPPQIYADLPGETVLANSRVIVQRFVIQPGQSTGLHRHAGRQLLVFVKGGVLTAAAGRSSLWPDGRVVWDENPGADAGSTNSGSAPIELLWVTLQTAPAAAGEKPVYGYLNYPNFPGEDLLENDWMIVQRFKMNPGQWEGIHAHNPNTFYIFIKGGRYLSKSKAHPEGEPGSAIDGTVAWMDTIDIDQRHESGNVGPTSSEVVWVALKH